MPLKGSIIETASLTSADIDRMCGLMQQYFINVTRQSFQHDLADKTWVIVLRDTETGQLHGFSTLCLLEEMVDDIPVKAFFSGDTIIDKAYWGSFELERTWFHFLYSRIDAEPNCQWYWFLICKGYRTFRYLPVYFHHYYPSQEDTPVFEQKVLDQLAIHRFGKSYRQDTGIIRCENDYSLRKGVSDITESERRDPRVVFFELHNPGWREGDELACLTDLRYGNLKRCAFRMLGKAPAG